MTVFGNAVAESQLPIYVLAWTTTPWTLPSNTALCVGPKIEYVAVKGQNPYTKEEAIYIVAKARKDVYFPAPKEEGVAAPEVIGECMGTDLLGLRYAQLFPWVKPCALENRQVAVKEQDAFRVIPGDYVTTEDGTGVVHIAPTFGADDAKVAKDAGIPSLFMIDKAGDTRPMVDFTGKYFVKEDIDETFVSLCVNDSYWHHAGDFVKNAYDPKYAGMDEKKLAKTEDLNIVLCMEMKQEGTAFKIEKHVFGQLVHPQHSRQGTHDGAEQDHPVEARINRYGPLRQMVGEPERLEPQPQPLLGHTAAYLAQPRHTRGDLHRQR